MCRVVDDGLNVWKKDIEVEGRNVDLYVKLIDRTDKGRVRSISSPDA